MHKLVIKCIPKKEMVSLAKETSRVAETPNREKVAWNQARHNENFLLVRKTNKWKNLNYYNPEIQALQFSRVNNVCPANPLKKTPSP